jgi:hypothetical protein
VPIISTKNILIMIFGIIFSETHFINTKSRSSSVGIVTTLRARFDSWQGHGIFLFDTSSRPALGPTESSYPKGTGDCFTGGKAAEA